MAKLTSVKLGAKRVVERNEFAGEFSSIGIKNGNLSLSFVGEDSRWYALELSKEDVARLIRLGGIK